MDDLVDEPALRWRPDLPAGPETVWQRRDETPWIRRWAAVLAVAIASGPFAIAAAMVENSFSGAALVLLLVAFGPLIEEIVKAAGALFLAEQRPWLVPAAWTLPVLTCLSGLVFASIENWWYLEVLIDDPSRQIIQWRWIFGPLVHGVGSLIVGIGAARLWRQAMTTGRRAAFDIAQPYIVTAAVFHGLYNGLALLLTVVGVFPDTP